MIWVIGAFILALAILAGWVIHKRGVPPVKLDECNKKCVEEYGPAAFGILSHDGVCFCNTEDGEVKEP